MKHCIHMKTSLQFIHKSFPITEDTRQCIVHKISRPQSWMFWNYVSGIIYVGFLFSCCRYPEVAWEIARWVLRTPFLQQRFQNSPAAAVGADRGGADLVASASSSTISCVSQTSSFLAEPRHPPESLSLWSLPIRPCRTRSTLEGHTQRVRGTAYSGLRETSSTPQLLVDMEELSLD